MRFLIVLTFSLLASLFTPAEPWPDAADLLSDVPTLSALWLQPVVVEDPVRFALLPDVRRAPAHLVALERESQRRERTGEQARASL